MATQTASASRTGEYTQVKKCKRCGRAFWTKRSWNGVTVKCPHCKREH